jgi:hypothetical protein
VKAFRAARWSSAGSALPDSTAVCDAMPVGASAPPSKRLELTINQPASMLNRIAQAKIKRTSNMAGPSTVLAAGCRGQYRRAALKLR